MLKAKASVTRLPYAQNSPLHIVCDPQKDSIIQTKIDRRIRIAKLLIAYGADPKENSSMGKNCFNYLAVDPFCLFDPSILTQEDEYLLLKQGIELFDILSKK